MSLAGNFDFLILSASASVVLLAGAVCSWLHE